MCQNVEELEAEESAAECFYLPLLGFHGVGVKRAKTCQQVRAYHKCLSGLNRIEDSELAGGHRVQRMNACIGYAIIHELYYLDLQIDYS